MISGISLDLTVPDHVKRDGGEDVGGTARRAKPFTGQPVISKRRKSLHLQGWTALEGWPVFLSMCICTFPPERAPALNQLLSA